LERYDRPKPERYVALAAECAAIAEKATDPRIKALNKAEANKWLQFAKELAEKPDEEADGVRSERS
jgi:hypothetical protein